jgi:hypothetical protein
MLGYDARQHVTQILEDASLLCKDTRSDESAESSDDIEVGATTG